MKWMASRGRDGYSLRFLRMLETVAGHRRLDEGLGLHSYVTCLVKGGELDVTSYMGAELLHPQRQRQRVY